MITLRSSIFDNPVIGDHESLTFGWTPEQLNPIIELLAPHLPTGLTRRMTRAVASVARSIVHAHKLSGDGVHYSRKTDFYNKPHRYRPGDPLYSHHFVTKSMRILESQGLVTTCPGYHIKYGPGYQSVAWATGKLVGLVGDVVDVCEERGLPQQFETIVLRDENKRDIDYADDEATVRMRAELEIINKHLCESELLLAGENIEIVRGRRIFNVTFDRGGRFYVFGESFQMTPSENRSMLELVVGGERRPVVEVDYSTLHPMMAYTEAGISVPDDDLYKIDRFHRDLVKRGVNVLLNAKTRTKAINALIEDLGRDNELRRLSGAASKYRNDCRAVVVPLVEALETKHAPIREFFGSDCGARYQRLDSDMAVEVMLRMIEQTGRCPLPIHDSFLVSDLDLQHLEKTMTDVADARSLPVRLKVTPAR
ncbi:hypothetical protein [Mycolicibacterium sp. XJ879]